MTNLETDTNAPPAGHPKLLFADFDPADPELRKLYVANHPLMVLAGGYNLATPAIVFAFTQIAAGIATGLPGMAWVAYPRFGKTNAAKYVYAHLGTTLENTPIVLHLAKTHVKPDEGRFYKELLLASGLAVPPGKDITERFTRLWKGWWAWVASQKAKRIVLVIDEANKLFLMEYSWLIDVANELAEKGVSLCIVLFAQPELVGQRSAMLMSGRMDIVGRFMVKIYNFEGIRSAAELAEVMQALDDPVISEYPTGSACSCTKFFAPRAFAAGWRLEHHAYELWAAFEECAANVGDHALAAGISVGMAWVRISFVYIMQRVWDADELGLSVLPEVWREAAERSGFRESLGVISKRTPANVSSE